MSLLPVQAVPVFILLLGLPSVAQPRPEGAQQPARQLELPALQGAAEVRVAPGVPTTLVFNNARLDRSAVEREGRELGFARVAVAEDTLTVVPGMEAQAGARLRLPVRFAEGPPQEGEIVVFVVDPPHAEAHVDVVRRMRTVPALEEALIAERARSAALEAEVAARDEREAELRAEQGSLAGLIEAGTLDPEGISVEKLGATEWGRLAELRTGELRVHVATGRVALVVELDLKSGARPWAPGGATLQPGGGHTSTRLLASVARLLRKPVLAPGERALLIVEFEAPTGSSSTPYRLEVLEQGGERALVLPMLELSVSAAPHR
ncbi:MAG TPA: DUF2381 family protein [Hyalangium sp.]|nr:DUF2381 family protein [Hyalangium sp.]